MKILYLITELDIGGAERNLYYLARGMAQKKHVVEAACLVGHGAVGKWLESAGVHVHYLNAVPAWPPSFVQPLRRVVRNYHPEVLHSFLFHANLVGRWAGWREKVPAVVCAVRVEDVERRWRLRLDGWTHWMMHSETCVSESAKMFTHKASRIPLEKLVAIPNAVEVARFDLARGVFRAELGIGGNSQLLVSIGRLERQKGIPFLLEAMKAVSEKFPESVLVLVGAGPDEKKLKGMAASLGLGHAVRFLGWRQDVAQILVDSDLLVLASLWEGMPNVVLEAMAAGRAVVATTVGGCPDLVVHKETGFLVPPREKEALASAIVAALSHTEQLRRMGEAGRRRAEKEFSVDRMIATNESLYLRLLSSSERRKCVDV